MNGKIILSFLAGFALASGVAFVLCRKKCRKNPPPDVKPKPEESAQSEQNHSEERPNRPVLGAQNPLAASPDPFGDPPPIINIDPARPSRKQARPRSGLTRAGVSRS